MLLAKIAMSQGFFEEVTVVSGLTLTIGEPLTFGLTVCFMSFKS